eukprot:Nitzschia sp. Nitz4//scaffold345_size17508//11578//16174//NITZ4_008825-RA/size17508-snap-gene-0.8-mRNA-1//-1//CDS//3329548634//621//frame0
MGKPKGGGGKKGGGKGAANSTTPRCSCEHPYNCDCGNRPPRPSKGHKWDPETQQWGGKGHKQKGASGQTSAVGQQAKVTQVGQTQIAQWQRLPSHLLQEFCKKQKRPPAKFKDLLKDPTQFKFRCIVPDAKDPNKDMFFVPSTPVANEEQSKEESAILALLHLTPTLPHESKLPEPYKTTWLTLVASSKEQNPKVRGSAAASSKPNDSTEKTMPSTQGTSKATANQRLQASTIFVSKADQKTKQDQRRIERNDRIRRHEAIRMANRDHPVFLSFKLRQQIQAVLMSDGTMSDLDLDDTKNAEALEPYSSDLQQYVEERLHHEGFSKFQARKSFEQANPTANTEDAWEPAYELCLQWLCLHIPEDQLPEGFDPQRQALDVGTNLPLAVQNLATKYGLVTQDAKWLMKQQKDFPLLSTDTIFWNKVLEIAGGLPQRSESTLSLEERQQIFQEEVDALNAMFPDDWSQSKNGSLTTVLIKTPGALTLTVVLDLEQYPASLPQKVLCLAPMEGCWEKVGVGVGLHVQMLEFLASMPLGEPMLFELYNHMQGLHQSMGEIPDHRLFNVAQPHTPKLSVGGNPKTATTLPSPLENIPLHCKRPRARGPFWSTEPSRSPPAEAFPLLPKSLEFQRKGLPAGKARSDFLEKLAQSEKASRVVLVTGDTGCGKTTQIPQFILEEFPTEAKIVVAQPRRLAATGVARRVAEERAESKPGVGSVGYVVRGDSAISKSTRLLFCTFGILLRQLQCDGALECVTHIVIDEVHERNLDGDVLMAILKDALRTYPNLRVILMSATLDADRFAAYWGTNTPRMHIPGRTFPVEDFFLEDVLTLTNYNPSKKKKRFGGRSWAPKKSSFWNDSEFSDEDKEETNESDFNDEPNKEKQIPAHQVPLEKRVDRVDETCVDYDLLVMLVEYLLESKAMGADGSILVFLQGAPEINQAMSALAKLTTNHAIQLLPLHGGLQPSEQNRVFLASPHATKVILSTNVAETSITIPDCTVVVDCCREKLSSYDPVNRMPLLLEVFASKASLKQRRGRAGRVREGKCYKMISKASYEQLHDHTAAEITRCALDQTVLTVMFLGLERGDGNFLKLLLDPPKLDAVRAATHSLLRLGALQQANNKQFQLTSLGMHIAAIPAPPVIGKLLIMGSILGCRRGAMAMAASISTGRSPFLRINPSNGQDSQIEKARSNLLEEAGNSDHARLAAAFINWEGLPRGGGARKQYCAQLGLSITGMRDILDLVQQYDNSLVSAGYVSSVEADRNSKSWRVLRTCAVAAMAPSQLVRVLRPSTKYDCTAEGAVARAGVAKELKFFVRPQRNIDEKVKEERVFIHPSSALFSTGNYSCPWLVYHSMLKTSKPFLRDVTECSAYALLLFGGKLEVEARNEVIIVDGWAKLSANARIGVLIGGLRDKMDQLLARKIEDPSLVVSDAPVMKLIARLLVTDGLDS